MKNLVRTLLLSLAACTALGSCGDKEQLATRNKRLATDVHMTIADHALVLPFAALERYAYRGQSFSFDRKGDAERARDSANQLLNDSTNAMNPVAQ